MKPTSLAVFALFAALLASGCNKKGDDATAQKLADLERKASEAVERQQDLERQIEEQKLASERDAIERERTQIVDARADLERKQGDAAAADAEKLRQREEVLAIREGKVDQLQSTLDQKADEQGQRDQGLSDSDRDLAGSEALASDNNDAPATPVGDYGMFHDSLAPYGSWFEAAGYGYVWQPAIVRSGGWHPYTRGRWACTDRGWTWMSEEPFGWATYHYGRWAPLSGCGWVWVPGSEWAPAWVSWRCGGNHIGWAPLPPETLAYRGHHWDNTVDVTCGIGASWYVFMESRHFGSPAHLHRLPYQENSVYLQETTNVTNVYVQNNHVICGGPRYSDVSNAIGKPMPFYHLDLDHHSRPGHDALYMRSEVHGDRLRIAAPNIDVAWNEGLKPSHVRGHLDAATVDRPAQPQPEVIDQFHKNREESQRQAAVAIAGVGGIESLNQHRTREFDANRRQIEQSERLAEVMRDNGKSRQVIDRAKQSDAGAAQAERLHMDAQRAQTEKLQMDAAQHNQGTQKLAQSQRGSAVQQEQELARQQQEVARKQQQELARQQQDVTRKQQQELARQQQEVAARQQQEVARQQQLEVARQQQEVAARQQQEVVRQQQLARQQQMELARQQQQELVRQQQERARQQQQEVARQQQELARQQQQVGKQQQQERGRQQQQTEDDKKRGLKP